MSDGDVLVGVVGKPFGVRGDVYVRPDPDVPHAFTVDTRYILRDGRVLTLVSARDHGNRLLVRFAEATDRDAAEALRGSHLLVDRRDADLDEDAYWTEELLGREVHDQAGALVGLVEAVADGPAHDYLVIARLDGGEVLVPAVGNLLTVTDDAIVVQAVPGLLDPDAAELAGPAPSVETDPADGGER